MDFTLALTPALSPEERENRSPSRCITKLSRGALVFRSKQEKMATDKLTSE